MLFKLAGALLALWLLQRLWQRYRRLPPAARAQWNWRIGLGGLALVLVLGAMTGRTHWFGAVLAGLIPVGRLLFRHGLRFAPFLASRVGAVPIRTQFLAARVDVKARSITGMVLKGPHADKALESLTADQLNELAAFYKSRDQKSFYLINFALHAGRAQSTPPPDFGSPDRTEALETLGLTGEPSRDEIIAAHRRLIQKLHPDRGGSDFLAARVNRAKDVLLNDTQR